MFEHCISHARHQPHAEWCTRPHVSRDDRRPHVIAHVHIQLEQHDIYDRHLEESEAGRKRLGTDDRRSRVCRGSRCRFDIVVTDHTGQSR